MTIEKEQKLGGGIVTLCIITIFFNVIGSLYLVYMFSKKDLFEQTYAQLNMAPPSTGMIVGSLILSIVAAVGAGLLLAKKELGIYVYFIASGASILMSILQNGFKVSTLIGGLLIPVLMLIFIWPKRAIFGLGKATE